MSRSRSSHSSALDTIETIAVLGAVALITMPVWKRVLWRWRLRHPRAATERMIDESLKYTFPASDPPATRSFDIPVNRR